MALRSRFWFGVMLWAGLGASALGGEPEWLEIRSPHFSVVTDAGEKSGREVAVRFEQMRAVFGALMTKAKVTMPTPLQIVAFRNTKEMRQFVPLWQGKPTEVAGLFLGNEDRNFILLDMSIEDPWKTVCHEYAHLLLNGNIKATLQPWFEEGFAEYFSTIEVTGKQAEVGRVPQDDGVILRSGSLMKVADLFRVQQKSRIYNESGDHRSLFYAQSWLVVHYLYDRQLMARANDYFHLAVDQNVPVETAIQSAFGMSAEDLDKAIRQYLKANQFFYQRIATPPGIEITGYTVKALSTADARAVLADMHMHSPDYQAKAMAEFEEVLRLQPDHPAALRGLGYAYLSRQDFPHAAEYFRRAASLDTDDPRVLYYSAFLIQQQEGPALGNDRQLLETIRKQLERAITLDSEFADAYSLLAFIYMSQGQYEQALATMLKAVALNPRSDGYAFNLAQMYLLNKNYDTAIAILERLENSLDANLAAQAARALREVQNAKLASAAGAPVEILRAPPVETETEIAEAQKATDPEISSVQEKFGPARFVKGRLVAVDCSTPPAAVLTVTAGSRTMKLHAKDRTRIIVIGADDFSCAWANRRVGVNYHDDGDAGAELISVELQ
jgi:Flp pilus assembly protein TadD